MRVLRNPPIREALAKVQIVADPGFKLEDLKTTAPPFGEHLSTREERKTAQMNLNFDTGEAEVSASQSSIEAFVYRSRDKSLAAQVRLDSFTLNRLHPYPGWEGFESDFLRYWDIYAGFAKPSAIVKVTLRYINRIPIGIGEGIDLWLSNPPPQYSAAGPIANFVSQRVYHQPTNGTGARVVEALDGTFGSNLAHLMLDVEVNHVLTEPLAPSPDQLLKSLRMLRDYKNRLFFESITEHAAERFS